MYHSTLGLLLASLQLGQLAYAIPTTHPTIVRENRTLDEIYQAALSEGGTVTLWHGGDEANQQNGLKQAFEQRFPGMTLNVTVDLSKYHDGNIDLQLAEKNVYVDSIILQTLHDYPRWKEQEALLQYQPVGFDQIFNEFKDPEGAYYGYLIFSWSHSYNTRYVSANETPMEVLDFLRPEWKNKLVLTYPNDDDAVLFAFDLLLQQYGWSWFDALVAQNPRWVRGTATPLTLVTNSNGTYTGTFTSANGVHGSGDVNVTFPTASRFVSWPQTGAILADAPHPESAKLLHNFILTPEYQQSLGTWSVRRDVPNPAGYPGILNMTGTDVTAFGRFMQDRAYAERLRFEIEDRIGTAQGLSPLIDDL